MMKNWWQQLQLREQRLVGGMSVLIGFFILYALIWQPLNKSITDRKLKIEHQQVLLAWVQENTARYQKAMRSGGTNSQGASLSSIVNRTSGRNAINIARMQPQGDDLQVWIDEVEFNQLLNWLGQLSMQEGLQVKNIDLSKADQQGVVRVRRLQLGKN
jgi:general secretion pathway protein M